MTTEARTKTDDPVRDLVARWGTPLRIIAFLVVAGGQVPNLISGKPFTVVSSVLLILFWAWLFFRGSREAAGDKTSIQYWRSLYGKRVIEAGGWTVVAVIWVTAGSALYGFEASALIVPAVPLFLVLGNWVGFRHAGKHAEIHAKHAESVFGV